MASDQSIETDVLKESGCPLSTHLLPVDLSPSHIGLLNVMCVVTWAGSLPAQGMHSCSKIGEALLMEIRFDVGGGQGTFRLWVEAVLR